MSKEQHAATQPLELSQSSSGRSSSPARGRLLVAGAGFLGTQLLEQFSRAGWSVVGMRRSLDHSEKRRPQNSPPAGRNAQDSKQLQYVEADLRSVVSLERVREQHGPFDWVIHCASTAGGDASAYHEVYYEGIKHLGEVFSSAQLGFCSSTSVFSQQHGARVDERSPVDSAHPKRGALLDAERIALGREGTVLRLSGLYGPRRCFLVKNFLSDKAVLETPPDGSPSRYFNQVRVEDVASAWLHLLQSGRPELLRSELYLCSDGCPMRQNELMALLASHFQRPLPPSAPPNPKRKRGLSSKQICTDKLRATGWQPRWPSFASSLKDGSLAQLYEGRE